MFPHFQVSLKAKFCIHLLIFRTGYIICLRVSVVRSLGCGADGQGATKPTLVAVRSVTPKQGKSVSTYGLGYHILIQIQIYPYLT